MIFIECRIMHMGRTIAYYCMYLISSSNMTLCSGGIECIRAKTVPWFHPQQPFADAHVEYEEIFTGKSVKTSRPPIEIIGQQSGDSMAHK